MDEEYERLKNKYGLPNWNILDSEFEISSIENDEFLLREIRKKIVDKIEVYAKILEDVLHPETTIICMHECKVFNEDEKEKLYDIYRKLMATHRESILLGLENGEKNEAEFIKKFYTEWSKIKPVFKDMVSKLKDSWLEDTELKEEVGYLG